MLLAFLQASIWPLNLGLILILTRAFVISGKANLFYAFGFGLLLSYLYQLPLGLLSLICIALVEFVYFWSKTPFSKNILTILPVIGGLILIVEFFTGAKIWPQILLEVALILPTFLIVRFWEERFFAPKEIKLRV